MYIKEREFTFGADPELFLRPLSETKKTEDNKVFYWSASGLVPGTKSKPFPVNGGAVQLDGMALEFNINPVKTKAGFIRRIKRVVGEARKIVEPKGFGVYADPVAYFDQKHYDEQPKEAKDLGCNPDMNAYTMKPNPTPKPPTGEIFRTGAGHIHIGWGNGFNVDDPEYIEACCHIVKHLDTCVGKPLMMVDPGYRRRELYGDVGAFRPKPFGVEYRSPSNFWLNTTELMSWVFDNTTMAIENAFTKDTYNYRVDPAPAP